MEGRRTIEGSGPAMLNKGKFEGNFDPEARKEWEPHRIACFEAAVEAQKQRMAALPHEPITITLPDARTVQGVSFETTPLEIARSISKRLAEDSCAAKVKYTRRVATLEEGVVNTGPDDCSAKTEASVELWDLSRPLEGDCQLELVNFDSPEGKNVFWHSSAHILGECLEQKFGCHLCIGPPLDNGFYYDAFMGTEAMSQEKFAEVQAIQKTVVHEKQPFVRVMLTKEQALEMFKHNPFKSEIIRTKVPENSMTTAYRCGTLIDLCRGPHLPDTGRVKAFELTKTSSAYWLADANNDSLQRVYGVSFPDQKQLKEYKRLLEEAAKRDHRNLGIQQELFFFSPFAPGSAFFLPHGARIYNRLMDFMRKQYRARGFDEVISPNLYHSDLFKTSGHYQNYKDDMFQVDVEKQEYFFKPMNCPGHCVMFAHSQRSYRDLPIRMADFGVLHRNELSGALTGLTRVRRFQQDDAHIYVAPDQIRQEIMGALEFMDYVYQSFGFKYELFLATKPAKALGAGELWEQAEAQLASALNEFGRPWKLNPGDGAFYGPKIDIQLFDALKRMHQCGTIQLDFQMPIRFNLQFRSKESLEEDEKKVDGKVDGADAVTTDPTGLRPGFIRPIMIHRAILGSMERMIAVLSENCGGKWPFFVSPRQVMVVPITHKFDDAARGVAARLTLEGYYADSDLSNDTLNKKIRNAQLAQYNFILCVGQEELESGTVDVRTRENERKGKMSIDALLSMFASLVPPCSKSEERLAEIAKYGPQSNAAAPQPAVNGQQPSADLVELNNRLADKSYLGGFERSQEDLDTYRSMASSIPDSNTYPHVYRWFKLMAASNQ